MLDDDNQERGKCNMRNRAKRSLIYNNLVVIFILFLFAIFPIRTHASQGSDIQKMLTYLKNNDYSKAGIIALKYKGMKADEKKYRNQLSKKAKKTFKSVLDSYPLYDSAYLYDSKHSIRKHLCGYFVKDLDGKGQPELCIVYGNGALDTYLYVYRFSNGKAVFVDKAYCDDCSWHDIPGKKGVIWCFARQGSVLTSIYTLKKNKLVVEMCGGYVGLLFQFNKHVTFKPLSSKRTVGVISYSAIK